jgi:hypothetical protein
MPRKWDQEAIKNAICELHRSGESLCYSNIDRHYRALLQAAARYFGTWEAAVTASGYDYDAFRRRPIAEKPLPGHEPKPRKWRRKYKLRLFG